MPFKLYAASCPSKTARSFIMNKGVPQGRALGLLSFNIFVADLASVVRNNSITLPPFANDMSLYTSHKTPAEACINTSHAMGALSSAMTSKGMAINLTKTVAMIILTKTKKNNR